MKTITTVRSLKALILSSALAACSAMTFAHFFNGLPETLPQNASALWFAPVFDFDADSCLPDAAISAYGRKNGGLKNSGSITGGCRHGGFMGLSNTYHRYVCKTSSSINYCAHVYALYFQKDQAVAGWDAFGHRHDFENVVVWTRNDQPTHVSVSAHGGLKTYRYSEVPKVGTHPKVVYHKDGGSTHVMRIAKSDENTAENPTGEWVRPPLASFYTMVGNIGNTQMTSLLASFTYGRANFPLGHGYMLGKVNQYKPSGYPNWTSEDMWASK